MREVCLQVSDRKSEISVALHPYSVAFVGKVLMELIRVGGSKFVFFVLFFILYSLFFFFFVLYL